jgi:hypothetical protein
MSIYLLEIYNEKTDTIPDFGLAFDSIDILLDYVNKQIQPIEESIRAAARNGLGIGWSIGLNKNDSIRVTKIPKINSADDINYTKYFKTEPQPNNSASTELQVPTEPPPEDGITFENIKDGNIVMNFNDLLTKETPVYYKRTTYNKYKPNMNPFEGRKIRTTIKTRKVKLVGNSTKNENTND